MQEVAKAIIFNKHKFLLQLRDDDSAILYPNTWSLFGGEINRGENPWHALQRELEEELEWHPTHGSFLNYWINLDDPCRIHLFAVPYEGSKHYLALHEGQDLAWYTLNEIKLLDFVTPQLVQQLISFEGSGTALHSLANSEF